MPEGKMLEAQIRIRGSPNAIKNAVDRLKRAGFTITHETGNKESRHQKKKPAEERTKTKYVTVEFKGK